MKYAHNGTAAIHYLTITDNHIGSGSTSGSGGGVYIRNGPYNSFTLGAVIIANNSDTNGSSPDCFGTSSLFSDDYNIIGDSTGCSSSWQTNDLLDAEAVPLNLGLLSDNQGFTQTHALLPDSVAIDRIASGATGCGSTYTSDQRGFKRPVDGNHDSSFLCDIGSYELQVMGFLPMILRFP